MPCARRAGVPRERLPECITVHTLRTMNDSTGQKTLTRSSRLDARMRVCFSIL